MHRYKMDVSFKIIDRLCIVGVLGRIGTMNVREWREVLNIKYQELCIKEIDDNLILLIFSLQLSPFTKRKIKRKKAN